MKSRKFLRFGLSIKRSLEIIFDRIEKCAGNSVLKSAEPIEGFEIALGCDIPLIMPLNIANDDGGGLCSRTDQFFQLHQRLHSSIPVFTEVLNVVFWKSLLNQIRISLRVTQTLAPRK